MAIGNIKTVSSNISDDFKLIREFQEYIAKIIVKRKLGKPIKWTK